MNEIEQPWIEETDPLIEYYGLITEHELIEIKNIVKAWEYPKPLFNPQAVLNESKIELLDFSDYDNEVCQFSLFKILCSLYDKYGKDVYWVPLNNECGENLFENYQPYMIAKTPLDIKYLYMVSHSYMQMLNGGYMVIDSGKKFIGLMVDGYYMLLALDEKLMNHGFVEYIENWNKIPENLGDIEAGILLSRNKSI